MHNTTRMQPADGVWNVRDWEAFDRLHDHSTAAKWRDGRLIEEHLFYDNGTILTQVGLT